MKSFDDLQEHWVGRLLAADIAILQLAIGIATVLTPREVWATSYPTLNIIPQELTEFIFIGMGGLGLFAAATNRYKLRQKFLLFEIFIFIVIGFGFFDFQRPIGAATYPCLSYMAFVRFIRLSIARGKEDVKRKFH